jgi:membrane protease YdiL (CAAX protease family)
VFAPALVALAVTARREGSAGVRRLLDRITILPQGGRWYVFAAGFFIAVKLTAALLHRALIGVWPPVADAASIALAPFAVMLSTPLQAGEEIGWRGFALPRLAATVGLPLASVALGLIWAAWHLPLFFVPGGDTFGQSFPVYAVTVTALSVTMAWLYWGSGGSLSMTMLMHAAINNTKDIVPSGGLSPGDPFSVRSTMVGWLTAGLLWMCAAYFLIRMRRARLESAPNAHREHVLARHRDAELEAFPARTGDNWGENGTRTHMMPTPVLKQFGDLTPDDFERDPVWIGCHTADYDEPWYEQTDEETFRPRTGALPADPSEGMLLVRATLTLGDGTVYAGFITPAFDENDLGTQQPQMFVNERRFAFWGGMPGTPAAERAAFYAAVGKDARAVFPITFNVDPAIATGAVSGTVQGFYRSGRKGVEIER